MKKLILSSLCVLLVCRIFVTHYDPDSLKGTQLTIDRWLKGKKVVSMHTQALFEAFAPTTISITIIAETLTNEKKK